MLILDTGSAVKYYTAETCLTFDLKYIVKKYLDEIVSVHLMFLGRFCALYRMKAYYFPMQEEQL
jgi:hypothetical protein